VTLLRPLLFLAAALALTGGSRAAAAEVDAAPEPGAIERTIPTQARQNSSTPMVAMPGSEARGHLADPRRFTLGAVNIDGATIFSQQQLSRYFEPYLATEVDQRQLARMADAITAEYRRTGYLLSYAMVPTQSVEAGMVRLAVVEGRIDKVTIQGGGSAQRTLEAFAAPLVQGGPLKGAALERAIGLIRDFPGLTVTDVALMRSDVEGGRYTLKISVVPQRVRAFTYADNRGTGSIGRSRVYNSLAISSLGLQGSELRADVFAMPGTRSRYVYGQLLASLPLGRRGMRLSISAARGDQYLRSDERFDGQSDNFSVQLAYPFLRSRAVTLSGKASLTDWRSLGTRGSTRQLRDRLRVARFGLELSHEGKTRFQGDISLSRGLGFTGMTQVQDPLASRPDASGKFTKLTLSAQLSRALGDRFRVQAVGVAQYSDRPLLSAEEFSLGGSRVGRAFTFNAETGDRGAGGGVELSYRLGKGNKTLAELFGFADGGVATDIKSPLSPRRNHSLASAGVGTRFSLGGATLSLEAGVPVSGNRHKPRLFASVFRSF
jgi:hemolysin activation/secretion protein